MSDIRTLDDLIACIEADRRALQGPWDFWVGTGENIEMIARTFRHVAASDPTVRDLHEDVEGLVRHLYDVASEISIARRALAQAVERATAIRDHVKHGRGQR